MDGRRQDQDKQREQERIAERDVLRFEHGPRYGSYPGGALPFRRQVV